MRANTHKRSFFRRRAWIFAVMPMILTALWLAPSGTEIAEGQDDPKPAQLRYEVREMHGWTVHIRRELFESDPETTAKALALLDDHLMNIVQVVPHDAVTALRRIQLWASPEYPGIIPRAEYHPDKRWLAVNGRDPAMAKGVEFTNFRIFEAETKRMPVFVLHELAHGYHDQVLSFENEEIKAAYRRAVESKSYDAVQRNNGKIERAYAMTNDREYFAESTEAFFGTNDFFPFNRQQLQAHDPEMALLLERLWNLPLEKR